MFNVLNVSTNEVMLGEDINSLQEIAPYVEYYRQQYGEGGQRNSCGVFVPCVLDPDRNLYVSIH